MLNLLEQKKLIILSLNFSSPYIPFTTHTVRFLKFLNLLQEILEYNALTVSTIQNTFILLTYLLCEWDRRLTFERIRGILWYTYPNVHILCGFWFQVYYIIFPVLAKRMSVLKPTRFLQKDINRKSDYNNVSFIWKVLIKY